MKRIIIVFGAILMLTTAVQGAAIVGYYLDRDELGQAIEIPVVPTGGAANVTGSNSNSFLINTTNNSLCIAVNGIQCTLTLSNSATVQAITPIIRSISGKKNNVYARIGYDIYNNKYVSIFTEGNQVNIQVIHCATGAETALGLDCVIHYSTLPEFLIGDKSYQETFIIGTGSAVLFPTNIGETQTYHETTGLRVLSSTNIESAELGNPAILLDFDAVGVNGAYFSGTITSQVFTRVKTDTITPSILVIDFTDSHSTIAGTQETITYEIQTGLLNPPTDGTWTSYTSGTVLYMHDPNVRWRAILSTSESPTLSPTLTRAALASNSNYTCGFKIYDIIPSTNLTYNNTSTLAISDGATGLLRFRTIINGGQGYPIKFDSPLTFGNTFTINGGAGFEGLFHYLPK